MVLSCSSFGESLEVAVSPELELDDVSSDLAASFFIASLSSLSLLIIRMER